MDVLGAFALLSILSLIWPTDELPLSYHAPTAEADSVVETREIVRLPATPELFDTLLSSEIGLPWVSSYLAATASLRRTEVLRVTTNAVLFSCLEGVPEGYPIELAGNLVLEIDTLAVYALQPMDVTLGPMYSEAEISGYDECQRDISYSLNGITEGVLLRWFRVRGVLRHFYSLDSTPTQLDFADLLLHADSLHFLAAESLVVASQTAILRESTELNSRQWSALSLPPGTWFWGSTSRERTERQVVLARRSGVDLLLTGSGARATGNPQDLRDSGSIDNCLGWSLPLKLIYQVQRDFDVLHAIAQDTLRVYRDAFIYVAPDATAPDPENRRGLVFYLPFIGPVADSLAAGSLPSLEEAAYTALEVGLWYVGGRIGAWYGSRLPASSNADDIVAASLRAGTPADDIAAASSRQNFRNVLIGASQTADDVDAHHIVPLADPRAAQSRQILREVGLDVTDPRLNGVVLDRAFHQHLHTNAYFAEVERLLSNAAGSRAEVTEVLQLIRESLLKGAFP